MAEINLQPAFIVDIIESESGWGQKLDEIKYFDSEPAALGFCKDYNKDNTATSTPEWYMVAQYRGQVR